MTKDKSKNKTKTARAYAITVEIQCTHCGEFITEPGTGSYLWQAEDHELSQDEEHPCGVCGGWVRLPDMDKEWGGRKPVAKK